MVTRTILSFLLGSAVTILAGEATPADQLKVPPGFKVELLRSAGAGEGSWSAMAIDAKGRLYISPQGSVPGGGFSKDNTWGGLWRVTLDAKGRIAAWEKVPVPVGDSMGMLWAFDSLYVSGQGPQGRGIYRLKDTNGDDTLDSAPLWKGVPGGNGEHGAHAPVLGPDGKSLYIAHGNSTPLVDNVDANSAYRNYAEDILIPRVMDPVATFFDKLKTPYGYVLKTDENGTKWELMAGGFRNQYDIDFNSDGELFTYDSDMEWDAGLPWYRPTRVLHVVPGAEFGFREGNQKWPEYYQDSLPATVDVGFGCPTGVKFGTNSNYPGKYRNAFFIMDWTFGRLLAVHMKAKGSSYTASNPLKSYAYPKGPESSEDVEVFLSGKGMPLTDLEFGKDGAMYFTVGGRGTQGGLYRVSYTGAPETTPIVNTVADQEIRIREAKLASINPGTTPGSRRSWRWALELAGSDAPLDRVFLALGDEDRFVRNAARVLLESKPSAQWKEKALAHSEAKTALTALLALARVGDKEDQAPLLKALAKFPLDSLDEELKLLKLRVIKVSFVRQGRPDTDLVNLAIEKLGKQYPAKSWSLNRELSELLVWLGAPDAVEKTLGLLESSKSPEEQIWYACMLREAQNWTAAQRERYFTWFPKARTFHGGNSFAKFIERIKDQALAKVSEAERGPLAELASKAAPAPAPVVPAVTRQFQKAWAVADFTGGDFAKLTNGRNLARGKEIYASTQCASCHHFGTEGGNVGPDLTGVGGRFQPRDILEAIIDPSKAISEQYSNFVFTMKNGEMAVGQVVNETNFYYDIIEDPIRGAHKHIQKSILAKKEVNPVSLMPPGLINVLTKDEVLDLLAYLTSGVPKQ